MSLCDRGSGGDGLARAAGDPGCRCAEPVLVPMKPRVDRHTDCMPRRREAYFVQTMTAIPRYRSHAGPVILSAGFRPFFLGASIWAAVAVPLWLGTYAEGLALPTKLAPPVWHAHEMVFGYAAATVAGFLLTAIPNWTGRMPLQGGSL